MGLFKVGREAFIEYSDHALTIALLIAAAIMIAIAMTPGHRIEKAMALAWIVLP